MTVAINLICDNAAFELDFGAEVARILQELASEFKEGMLAEGDGINLRDANGNKVGECYVNAWPPWPP